MLKHRLLPRLVRLPVWLCLLLCAAQANAERWYRVELLAFSQQGGELSEKWPAKPELVYPAEGRFLLNPSEVTVAAKPIDASTDDADSFQNDADEAEPRPSLPAFTKLPESRKGFGDAAATMARSSRYKVLFHETWIQPVGSKSAALPLILDRSGDTGSWPLLQGSVKLWLSRYLHLETNLWLNTQGNYLKGEWRMPSAPLGPRAVASSAGNALYAGEQPIVPPAQREQSNEINQYWNESEPTEASETGYPYRHAIALKQKRRMRSKEVHYIDHPMLGLMIKLTPLKTSED